MRIKTLFAFVMSIFLTACSETVFHMADGSEQALGEYKGQWLLINYWAEWCRPCLEEIPELNVLNQEEEIQVLGFDYDNAKGATLDEKIKRLGIAFPTIQNEPSILFSQNAPSGLPATMLINKDGKFEKWLMGPQTTETIQIELEK